MNTINAVYYVESSNPEKKYNPIAVRPEFFYYKTPEFVEQRCEWRDTDRGAHFYFQKIIVADASAEEIPRQFKLIENGEEITFTYMTAELFNEKVSGTLWKKPSFSGDIELQKYYLDNLP